MDVETQRRIDGLPENTGKALTEWFTILGSAGFALPTSAPDAARKPPG
ncbi:hypothetical protein [Mycetocola sp.]